MILFKRKSFARIPASITSKAFLGEEKPDHLFATMKK